MNTTPIVIIRMGSDIDEFYEQILMSIDARYHSYRLSEECERMGGGMTEAQWGELETFTMYAEHAGDNG